MPKLYTRTGDRGKTSLYDMKNISKADWIFKVLGDLDELSAHIGLLCVLLQKNIVLGTIENDYDKRMKHLRRIQTKLLDLGSNFSTMTNRVKTTKTTGEDVKDLENQIDFFDANTPKLTEFILAGAGENDSQAQICRAVCRRAERNMWTLIELEESDRIEDETFQYINRLSDYFFALSRYLTSAEGLKEITRRQANESLLSE